MAGTDLREGTGTQPDKIVTVDRGGTVGNGLGQSVTMLEARLAGRKASGSDFSVDLKPFIVSAGGHAVYEVHAHIYNTAIDYNRYAKFIVFGHTLASEKVYIATETDSSTWSMSDDAVLTRNGGGNRSYQVRIKRIL